MFVRLIDVVNGYLTISAQSLRRLEHSRLPDLSQSTFCDRRHPKHGQIDWSNSAKEVFNFIRAQTTPYPGAFSGFDGEKILIWSFQKALKVH